MAMTIVERDSQAWRDGWAGLKALGHSIDDYMLMYAMGNLIYFKHADTRKYVTVPIGRGQ